MKKIFTALLLFVCSLAVAQNNPQTITAVNGCVKFDVQNVATLGIKINGTFSGATLQPEIAIAGQSADNYQVSPSTAFSTPQSTITGVGSFATYTAGFTTFYLCATALSSGTVNVWFQPSSRLNAGLLGGGGGTGSGTVTSVALSLPAGLFTISGSPVSNSGTLTGSFVTTLTANTFFAAPNGSTGAPSFRAIVAADVPTLNQSTTGNAATATSATSATSATTAANLTGCTGSAAGDVCYWNGSAWTRLAGNITTTNFLQETSAGVPSWASPSGSGTVTTSGSPASTQVAFFSGATAITSSANLTYAAASGFSLTQGANNVDAFFMKRNTDTSPTGNFLHFQNAAASSDLFKLDVSGNTTQAGTVTATSLIGSGSNGGYAATEGTGASVTFGASIDGFYPDSTNHCLHQNLNNVDKNCIPNTAGSGIGLTTGGTISVSAAPLTGLATQTADTVVMNATGSTASPTAVTMPTCATSGHADVYDPSTHAWTCNVLSGGTSTIANGTSAMGTGAISSGTCATVVTTTATGVAATDAIIVSPNADPTGVTGYAVSATGSLYIQSWPTSGNVNFKVCNNTAGSLTPAALTLNWRVVR